MRYDIAVIGNDEAALELLCIAGAAGKRTLSVLPEQRHSEWMVSIALRRLVEQLLTDRTKSRRRLLEQAATPRLLHRLLANALTAEVMDHATMLEGLGVDVLLGEARLLNRSSMVVTSGIECRRTIVNSDNIVIGSGTRRTAMHRPLGLMPFHRPESLLSGFSFPRALNLLGGDQLGAGMAAMLSLFGVETQLLTSELCPGAMHELARAAGVKVAERIGFWNRTDFCDFNSHEAEVVDFRRSVGFTEHLGLASVGVEPDEHGLLWCGANLETWCQGIFGIGDVVGFSADISRHPTDQAKRIMNRINHRIRRPHFLRLHTGSLAGRVI